jgi:hypothetical protein
MPTLETARQKAAFDMSNALFVSSFLLMCLCEAYMIHSPWFRNGAGHHGTRGSDLPFLIWVSCIAGVVLRFAIGNRKKRGEIDAFSAVIFNNSIGAVLLLAYLLMARLAEVAFS